jgi:hypothetical protein
VSARAFCRSGVRPPGCARPTGFLDSIVDSSEVLLRGVTQHARAAAVRRRAAEERKTARARLWMSART